MKRTTINIAKNNWSGEQVEFDVTEFAGTFEWDQDGCRIELRNRCQFDGWTQFDVYINSNDSGFRVGKMHDEASWTCLDGDETIERQCSNLEASGLGQVGAAAMVLHNTM